MNFNISRIKIQDRYDLLEKALCFCKETDFIQPSPLQYGIRYIMLTHHEHFNHRLMAFLNSEN